MPQAGVNGVEQPKMPIVVVASQKGGSGKTTIAAHLAVRGEASASIAIGERLWFVTQFVT